MSRNDSTRDAEYDLLSIGNLLVESEASIFILDCLKALKETDLRPIDLVQLTSSTVDVELRLQLAKLLQQIGLVRGSVNAALFTREGRICVEHAAASDHRVAQFLLRGSRGVERDQANEIVLAVLRAHFNSSPSL